ncbi:MAG: putative bifunctional diguanylate cyclase/phosphodiesterase [Pseudomonadota bacterium]
MIRSFRTRLLVILLLLVAGALSVSLSAIGVAVQQQVQRSVEQELSVSDRVFRELLASRSQLLLQAAQVLTDDFGFKRAVASGDRETIVSALVNHGERIDTELMVLRSPDGEEIAATHPLSQNIIETTQGSTEQQLAVVDGELFQLITVPVNAPQLIARATLGFRVDSELAQELQSLANADISLWLEDSKQVLASSLNRGQQSSLQGYLKSSEAALKGWLEQQNFVGQEALLETAEEQQVHVLLSASLAAAMADFDRLRSQMVFIALVALIIAALIALWIARSVSQPLYRLTEAAKQLQRGDYSKLELQQRGDEFGQLVTTFDSMRDAIAEREQRISFQATHDQLTGLPNRRFFAKKMSDELEKDGVWTLLLVNIYQFRVLNDTLGQVIGDQVLKQIGSRLLTLSKGSQVARVGGDEFAIVVDKCIEGPDDELVAELDECLAPPVKVGESDYPVSFNCGAVCYPRDGNEFDTLLRRVQVSVQQAKREQKFIYFYSAGLDEQHLRKLTILEHLQTAVEKEELAVLLQPKIDCATGRTQGAEVLLRWHNPQLGFVGPDEFIPLAEQSGLIKSLTRWVCEQSVKVLEQLQPLPDNFTLSVNLSAVDLLSDEVISLIEELEQQYPQLSQYLVLEVTESVLVDDPETAIERLNWFRNRGYGVSIDDYGTGYSSLAQMRQLPVTELKIDRAFVQLLATSPVDQSIVRSTIQLAHELRLSVVAEGVEDEQSWNWLKQQHCDVLQGFYFSKPIPFEEFNQRLQGESDA